MTEETHREIAIRRIEMMKRLGFIATAVEILGFYAEGLNDKSLNRYIRDVKTTIANAQEKCMARVTAGIDKEY